MKNIDLNPGGLIGALVCGGIVMIIAFSDLKTAEENGSAQLIAVSLVGGAFAGNTLWEKLSKKPK